VRLFLRPGHLRNQGSPQELASLSLGQVHGITLGSLDGDPDVQIQMHIFVASKASWDYIGGSAEQFEEFPK